MELWVCGLGPAGKGLAEELGCLPAAQALSMLSDHNSTGGRGLLDGPRLRLQSAAPLGPQDWPWKLLSTL